MTAKNSIGYAKLSELLHRSKTGFSFPIRDWIVADMKTKERRLRGWARVVHRETQRCLPDNK